jgi:hypothetical protein
VAPSLADLAAWGLLLLVLLGLVEVGATLIDWLVDQLHDDPPERASAPPAARRPHR